MIVSFAELSSIDAFDAFERVILIVSSFSSISSSRIGTLNVADVLPAGIVNVPEVAV